MAAFEMILLVMLDVSIPYTVTAVFPHCAESQLAICALWNTFS
jgi:hypothetical protein